MDNNTTNFGNFGAKDPFTNWAGFQDLYILPDSSVNENSNIHAESEAGSLRKSSEETVVIRKITAEMLNANPQLAAEIHEFAMRGRIGFATTEGTLQFREDIAKEFGEKVMTFKIIHHDNTNPESIETVQTRIESVENEPYSSLAKKSLTPHMHSETGFDIPEDDAASVDKPEDDSDELEKTEETSTHLDAISKSIVLFAQPYFQKIGNVIKAYIAERMIEQIRKAEEKRREHAQEVREEEKEKERDQIKVEILKREIKNEEIQESEVEKSALNKENKKEESIESIQTANTNYGDGLKDLTNNSIRSTVSLQDGDNGKKNK